MSVYQGDSVSIFMSHSVKITISLKDIWDVFLGSLKIGIHENVVISKQT